MDEKNNINFWEITLDQENNNIPENFSNSNNESLISKINQDDNKEIHNTINLDNIKIQEIIESDKPKVNFQDIDVHTVEKKRYHINYRKTFILSFTIIVLTSLVSLWLSIYNSYLTNYSTESQTQDSNVVNNFQKIKDFFNKYISKDHWISNDIELSWINWMENLDKIINTNMNYIQKKEILNNSVKKLSNLILWNYKNLEDIKKSITRVWFFSDEISNIISNEEQISSIQNSLLSLEAIKFSSAINVFPYLDTFVEWLANSSQLSKEDIEEETKSIIARWDKDINLYIRNCYLNPFEINYDCKIIWDFEKYYILTDDLYFNTNFFKQLVRYTDMKLEQTELPSFSINFQKFDKNSNQITFNIDINTFKQDEIELAKKGIVSPHFFILNNLINNLRQSRFILGKWIIVKTLKVEPKTINIGTTEFTINNSNKSFTVDIQKESEREIDDFVNINN